MNVKDIIADSNLAFINQEFDTALKLAKEAIKLDKNNANAYKSAGNACISLGRYDEAIRHYESGVKCDPNNGNRYYDLGFALASVERLADAMKSFAKAEELGCTPENIVQLYNLLGIICFDIGRYGDALINLSKAEQIVGVDVDILQRKAVIYGVQNDIRKGLLTANQIKLVSPSEYKGYQIAIKLLMQAKRYEAVKKEFVKAEKYTTPSMELFFDKMTFELDMYRKDGDKKHYHKALALIEKALEIVKPTVTNVIDSYINAAEIHLQLENADQTIHCLNAAQNPIGAFNEGFEIIVREYENKELTEYDLEDMMEEDRIKIEEEYGEYGLEELAEGIEPDEDGNRDYFTEIEEEEESEESVYRIDDGEKIEFSKENEDQVNRLYVGAYTLKRDFDKVIEYARKLQASENIHHSYIGTYAEANAHKELGSNDTEQKYNVIIKFFRNAMIKDPTDIMAVTFRIQCYIDIGQYDEAEQMCNLLTKELKEPLLERIQQEKSGGE